MNSIEINIKNQDSPYMGLKPYEEEHAYKFKGRVKESNEVYQKIVQNDYVVCYAESGEGKTSLLNAGVMPLLRQNEYFPVPIRFTDDDYKNEDIDFDEFVLRLINEEIRRKNRELGDNAIMDFQLIDGVLSEADDSPTEIVKKLDEELESKYAWWLLHTHELRVLSITLIPILVFDQFEEYFDRVESPLWTNRFFSWLQTLSSDVCPEHIELVINKHLGAEVSLDMILPKRFKALFSLRSDSIGELDYWCMQRFFIPSLKNNRYCLKPMTYLGAQKVIGLEPSFSGIASDILKALVDFNSNNSEKLIAEDLPVIPALLLSVICESLNKSSSHEIARTIGNIKSGDDTKNAITEILADFYEEILSMCHVSGEVRNVIESALVDEKGKRVRIKSTQRNLEEINFDRHYKEILCKNRIIKKSKINSDDYVELVHDSLCPVIMRHRERLKKEEEQRILAEQAMIAQRRRSWTNISLGVLTSILACLLVMALYKLYYGNDNVIATGKYNVYINTIENDDVAGLWWKGKIEVIGRRAELNDTILFNQIVYRTPQDTVYSFEVDSTGFKQLDFHISYPDFPQFRDTIISRYPSELGKDPNVKIPIKLVMPHYTDYGGQLIVKDGNRPYYIQDAIVVLNNKVAHSDSVGKFIFHFLNDVPADEKMIIIKKGFSTEPLEPSLTSEERIYELTLIDSLNTFRDSCAVLDSLTRNGIMKWQISFNTEITMTNSKEPANLILYGNVVPMRGRFNLVAGYYYIRKQRSNFGLKAFYMLNGKIQKETKTDDNGRNYNEIELEGLNWINNKQTLSGKCYGRHHWVGTLSAPFGQIAESTNK